MKTFNMTSFASLEELYIQKLIDKVSSLNVSSIVWQEVYTNGVRLPQGTVVHVWTGNQKKLLAKVENYFNSFSLKLNQIISRSHMMDFQLC